MNPFLVHFVGSDMHRTPLIAMYVAFFSVRFANKFSIRLMGARKIEFSEYSVRILCRVPRGEYKTIMNFSLEDKLYLWKDT